MEIKKLLTELGYDDNQIDSITTKKKIYFQNDVDNIVEKNKTNIESKIKDKYVAKEEYDVLNSNFNNLNKEIKTNDIKEVFKKLGGKEGKEFDAFIKLNEDLLDVEKESLEKSLSEKATDYDWAFHKNTAESNSFGNETNILSDLKQEQTNNNDNLVEGTIYRNFN